MCIKHSRSWLPQTHGSVSFSPSSFSCRKGTSRGCFSWTVSYFQLKRDCPTRPVSQQEIDSALSRLTWQQISYNMSLILGPQNFCSEKIQLISISLLHLFRESRCIWKPRRDQWRKCGLAEFPNTMFPDRIFLTRYLGTLILQHLSW